MRKEVSTEVDIEFSDVWEYVTNHSSIGDQSVLYDYLKDRIETIDTNQYHFPCHSLNDQMKVELLQEVFNHFSLQQLEDLFGNKFQVNGQIRSTTQS
jgi:hypothetical protein